MAKIDQTRQPTSLERLTQLIQLRNGEREATDWEVDNSDVVEAEMTNWLTWTLTFLENRKLYHKKSYVRKSMLERMAKQLLSKDELERIDAEAEAQVAKLDLDVEPVDEEVTD